MYLFQDYQRIHAPIINILNRHGSFPGSDEFAHDLASQLTTPSGLGREFVDFDAAAQHFVLSITEAFSAVTDLQSRKIIWLQLAWIIQSITPRSPKMCEYAYKVIFQ